MLFRYVSIDGKNGKEKKGKISAISKQQAIQELKKQGLYISEMTETKESIWSKDLNIHLGKVVKDEEFVVFCRQLATLLRAGTPVVDSIRILSDQGTSKAFRQALEQIYEDLRSGMPLSDACDKHAKVFDTVFVNMVKAGEVSGNLENIMDRLATFFEKERMIREKVKSALMYPAAVSIVAVIVVIILLTQVLPNLVSNLTSVGGEIPWPTKVVMGVSDFLIEKWYLLLLAIVLISFVFIALKRNPKTSYWIDYLKLKLPVFGVLIQKSLIARLTRMLASLFGSSVPALQALAMGSDIVNNRVFTNVLEEARESLRRGETLAEPLANSWVFPKLVSHMMSVGEESGQLDIMLEKVADFYEQDVEQVASRLSAIIEPVMIVILSVVVGSIVLAALLPMFSVYQQI